VVAVRHLGRQGVRDFESWVRVSRERKRHWGRIQVWRALCSSSDRRSSSVSAPGRERTGRPGDDGETLIASSSVGRRVNDRIEGKRES
jgi:hypothetical protein